MQLKNFDEQKICFEELFSYTDGYKINRDGICLQNTNHENSFQTMYGEARFETVYQIFSNPKIQSNIVNAKKVYDLGSGVGNVVISLGILNFFEEIHGIELTETSYNEAVFLKNTLNVLFPDIAKKIHFHKENFLDYDFSDADVVFVNNPIPSKYKEAWQSLEQKLQDLKKGTVLIYVIATLENDKNFKNFFTKKFQFSWGEATVRAYVKLK